jgi:Flp pilus assembly protein TadG
VSARGQAAIEFVFAACLAGIVAVGTLPLFQVWQARSRAERIADQAAVLVAEGRPLTKAVTAGGRVEVDGHAVRATVPVTVLGHAFEVTAVARTR